ncbi:M48 family metalloprotease [Lacihabitans lacunae]|jgi:beta-barrel assembly-enhancing protease|uniref:M48 family metalloprotease n=1 Tax=Lacihabitans lacunae TaxID=1028214 RepID=A0ABV7YXZ5_9BACT
MNRSGLKLRLVIGLVMAAMALFSYYSKTQANPMTGEKQQVSLSPQEEVAMGLQSAPEMAQQYGGLYPDQQVQNQAQQVGEMIVRAFNRELEGKNIANPYKFNFHVLRDDKTINAFALPGGQIFITAGLLGRLKSKDQLAGVLGHEVGHVIYRHSSEQMAKTEFYQGLAGAATAAAGDMGASQIANYVAQVKLMKFGRDDELESDEFGIKYMIEAGYEPSAMIEVMEILAAAGGGKQRDEFMSTHPSPDNRIAKIQEHIQKYKK